MFGALILMAMFWISVSSEGSSTHLSKSATFLDKKKRSAPRGYYGGVGYPYVPFAEPLTILAGLAFLAYIIQAFHSVYYHHGLGGGLLTPKRRKLFRKARNRSKRIKFRD